MITLTIPLTSLPLQALDIIYKKTFDATCKGQKYRYNAVLNALIDEEIRRNIIH